MFHLRFTFLLAIPVLYLPGCLVLSAESVLAPELHHLRIEGPREWVEFPETPAANRLLVTFNTHPNDSPQTLRLRQQDVKQSWRLVLNGKELGRLPVDENDMVVYFPVPPGTLSEGENSLLIEQDVRRRSTLDDVRVGEIVLDDRAVGDVLAEAKVEVKVVDARTDTPTPSRITVLNADGSLQTVGAQSNDHLAVRPGIVFTSNGHATFGLPAGEYTIYAGRGFEYSLARESVRVDVGESVSVGLEIRRQVPTEGFVACDPHIHTATHSGHGDASMEERMITLAGEGIELPVATDHNVHISYESLARELGVRRYFTPVIGNEVTTPSGHFNVFPVAAGARPPGFRSREWRTTLDGIYRTPGVKVTILNHPRDLHSGTRPFGPKLHNGVVGENLEGWHLGFDAMEVINSGATQTDVMQLFRDWMGLLNRGRMVTPVGSSDSHDVGRHFVGQGRTYIRCDDRDPGNIDVEQVVNSFLQGQVMVSYGLLAEITVDGKYGPGELAVTPGDEVQVAAQVLGPSWVTADRIQLFANGKVIREATINRDDRSAESSGVIWSGGWTLPKPRHDVYLTAIAVGPGVDGLYWKTAKAYQPDSPRWEAHVVGCSGAVWLDVDGDGRRTSAYEYARRLVDGADGDLSELVEELASYDEAVASQVAHQIQLRGTSLRSDRFQRLLKVTAPATQAGVREYLTAWRANQLARGARDGDR